MAELRRDLAETLQRRRASLGVRSRMSISKSSRRASDRFGGEEQSGGLSEAVGFRMRETSEGLTHSIIYLY